MTDMREIVVERDMMVPARDGVLLATDVYRPAGPGPYPVLLERTPYDQSAVSRSERWLEKGARAWCAWSAEMRPHP
jgi:predicted acyl esterase